MFPEAAGDYGMDNVVRHFVVVAFAFGVQVGAFAALHLALAGKVTENGAEISHKIFTS
jgi:hypothetical protein